VIRLFPEGIKTAEFAKRILLFFFLDETICKFMFDFILLLAKLEMIPFVGQPILQGGRHNETGYQRDQG
jgi:hypothetical protein